MHKADESVTDAHVLASGNARISSVAIIAKQSSTITRRDAVKFLFMQYYCSVWIPTPLGIFSSSGTLTVGPLVRSFFFFSSWFSPDWPTGLNRAEL